MRAKVTVSKGNKLLKELLEGEGESRCVLYTELKTPPLEKRESKQLMRTNTNAKEDVNKQTTNRREGEKT